jgi:hypothetical protein
MNSVVQYGLQAGGVRWYNLRACDLTTQEAGTPMTRALPREMLVAMVVTIVLLQATSCCCLGGAVTPAMTPYPTSTDLAQQMRARFNAAKARGGAFTLEVSDRELTSYVVMLLQSGAGEFPARDMQIEFGDGYVDIWATFIEVAPSDLPSFVRATIAAVDGHLVFQILQANAGPIPVPGALRETIAQVLSETLDELELGLDIQLVEVEPGRMVLTGQVTGEVPDLPERL